MHGVRNVLYVLVLSEYLGDLEFEVSLVPLTTEQDLTFETHPILVLERSERVLRYRHGYTLWCYGHVSLSEKRLGR